MPRVRFALGVDPEHADKMDGAVEEQIKQLASDKRVCAIGNCGLSLSNDETQIEAFVRHITLAAQCEKPLIVSAEGAYEEALSILMREGLPKAGVLVRAFAGTAEQLKSWVDAGCYVSFDNRVTHELERFCQLARLVPADRVLVESGALPQSLDEDDVSDPELEATGGVAPLAGYPPRPDQVVFVVNALLGICRPDQLAKNYMKLFG